MVEGTDFSKQSTCGFPHCKLHNKNPSVKMRRSRKRFPSMKAVHYGKLFWESSLY